MRGIFISLIRLYQGVHGVFFTGCCRFYPSCSQYAIEALEAKGFLKGSALTAYRILRCNPFCKSGYDPVPGCDTPTFEAGQPQSSSIYPGEKLETQ